MPEDAAAIPPGEPGSPDTSDCQLHPKARLLPFVSGGAMIVLPDDRLMDIQQGEVRRSADNGQTWSRHPVFPDHDPVTTWFERYLLRCHDGTLVLIYQDRDEQEWGWDNERHEPAKPSRLPLWSTRSTDEGATWEPPVMVSDGYIGALQNAIVTEAGRLVVPVQRFLTGYGPARHVQTTCVSDDQGRTWRISNLLDVGGHGHHDGCFEASVTQLTDGRLWMLIRTNLDRFWQAYSEDDGSYWRTLLPSGIDASSAPPSLLRLQSGWLMLAWNRLYPVGLSEQEKQEWERAGGECNVCQPVSSWHRRELSVAFSRTDGATWTDPVVLGSGRQLTYPFLLERSPGEIWVSTCFGQKLGIAFAEEDLRA